MAFPQRFRRLTYSLFAAALCAISASILAGQQTAGYAPAMTFDVASIHETHPVGSHAAGGPMSPHSARVDLTNVTALMLIQMAYGLDPNQTSGAPSWATSNTYDIHASADRAAEDKLAKLTDTEAKLEKQHMLQTLLTDRFAFKFHKETKDGPVYELTLARSGSKLHETREPTDPTDASAPTTKKPKMDQGTDDDGLLFIANGLPISEFANWLTSVLRQPVLDKTSLTAKYDFTLHYFKSKNGRPSDDPSKSPPLEVALPEQLGLKLQPARGPIETLAIDKLEKPSEN